MITVRIWQHVFRDDSSDTVRCPHECLLDIIGLSSSDDVTRFGRPNDPSIMMDDASLCVVHDDPPIMKTAPSVTKLAHQVKRSERNNLCTDAEKGRVEERIFRIRNDLQDFGEETPPLSLFFPQITLTRD